MGNPYYGEQCVKSYIFCVEKSDALNMIPHLFLLEGDGKPFERCFTPNS
jgi:hypothetical protein